MNFLVTGGGTIAPIDDVRAITNVSTGRSSAAISEAILARGGSVWHVHTPLSLTPFADRARLDLTADIQAESSRLAALKAERDAVAGRLHLIPLDRGTVPEYAEAVRTTLRDRPIDVAILAMAVSDYAPDPVLGKLDSTADRPTLPLRRVPKIIASVRDWSPGVYLVGFKLLSGSDRATLIDRARVSGRASRADLTVANDLRELQAGRHTLHLVRPGQADETLAPGPDLAGRLVDRIMAWADRR